MKSSALLAGTVFLLPLSTSAENSFSTIGTRLGLDAETGVALNTYELYAQIDTDWSWKLSDQISLDVDLNLALGVLDDGNDFFLYGHIGPEAKLHFGDFPVSLVISTGISVYSEHEFDNYDIGSNFQFTSSIGLAYQITDHWDIGYRIQHTSNAGLSSNNLGLDMHVISIGFSF